MASGLTYVGTVVGATGSGVMGGLLFAFSTAVMPALRKQPPGAGMRAMQHVNRLIPNPVFLLVFVGTALVCLALAVGTLFGDQPHEVLRAIGALLYVVGAFGVTAVVNVPLNNALDRHHDDEAGHAYWAEYLAKWVPWNHLRAVTAVAGTVLMILSLG
jgi:uncharacterized membrane protein